MSADFRAALESITRHRPIMGSTGDYRQGQLDTLESVSRIARTALTANPNPAPVPVDEEVLACRSFSSHSHVFESDLVDFARAVLARYGTTTPAPVPVAETLQAAGVFKGAHGLAGLLNADDFWEQMQYGTRLYYGQGIADYLHRDVLRAAVRLMEALPAPAEPTTPPEAQS